MTKLTKHRITMWPLFLCLFLLGAATSSAQTTAADSAPNAAAVDAAQKAAIDPATGRLRGVTPEEARALVESVSRQLSQSDEGLTIVYHANGVLSVNLDDRFESAAMVRVEPDGSLKAQCVTSVEEAERFLAGQLPVAPKSAPSALEEK